VDYSARIQTVHAPATPGTTPYLAAVLRADPGCPVIVTPSFNVRWRTNWCVHSGDALSLLHGHEYGGPGGRKLIPAQERTGHAPGTAVAVEVRSGLTAIGAYRWFDFSTFFPQPDGFGVTSTYSPSRDEISDGLFQVQNSRRHEVLRRAMIVGENAKDRR